MTTMTYLPYRQYTIVVCSHCLRDGEGGESHMPYFDTCSRCGITFG